MLMTARITAEQLFSCTSSLERNLHLIETTWRNPGFIHPAVVLQCSVPPLCPLPVLCQHISSTVVGLLALRSPSHALQRPSISVLRFTRRIKEPVETSHISGGL